MGYQSHKQAIPTDDTSSVYSRSPESPKFFRVDLSATLSPKHQLPEINSLDHQIALLKGSTMALETTRVRLQACKAGPQRSAQEMRRTQFRDQANENRFYRTCRFILHDLLKATSEVCEIIELQYDFEPEVNPLGNKRVLEAANSLKRALNASSRQEKWAEEDWKRKLTNFEHCDLKTAWI